MTCTVEFQGSVVRLPHIFRYGARVFDREIGQHEHRKEDARAGIFDTPLRAGNGAGKPVRPFHVEVDLIGAQAMSVGAVSCCNASWMATMWREWKAGMVAYSRCPPLHFGAIHQASAAWLPLRS
jgi:hypothetical protein